jgi:hypothetical protein
VTTASGVATVSALAWLPAAQLEMSALAALSAEGCGDAGGAAADVVGGLLGVLDAPPLLAPAPVVVLTGVEVREVEAPD